MRSNLSARKWCPMPSPTVIEKQIADALQRVPSSRWGEVLDFVRSLEAQNGDPSPLTPIITARDLAQSDLIGLWANRVEVGNSQEFARRLRERGERHGARDASPH
jgi:hypothetical protein